MVARSKTSGPNGQRPGTLSLSNRGRRPIFPSLCYLLSDVPNTSRGKPSGSGGTPGKLHASAINSALLKWANCNFFRTGQEATAEMINQINETKTEREKTPAANSLASPENSD